MRESGKARGRVRRLLRLSRCMAMVLDLGRRNNSGSPVCHERVRLVGRKRSVSVAMLGRLLLAIVVVAASGCAEKIGPLYVVEVDSDVVERVHPSTPYQGELTGLRVRDTRGTFDVLSEANAAGLALARNGTLRASAGNGRVHVFVQTFPECETMVGNGTGGIHSQTLEAGETLVVTYVPPCTGRVAVTFAAGGST